MLRPLLHATAFAIILSIQLPGAEPAIPTPVTWADLDSTTGMVSVMLRNPGTAGLQTSLASFLAPASTHGFALTPIRNGERGSTTLVEGHRPPRPVLIAGQTTAKPSPDR